MELTDLDERESGTGRAWRLARQLTAISGAVAISALALAISSTERSSRMTPPVPSSPPAVLLDGDSIVLAEAAPQWQVLRLGVAARVRDRWTDPFQARLGIGKTRAEVPVSALITDGERQYVYVLTGPDRMTRRAVATGSPVGDRVPIESGVTAGDTVVEEGALLLENEIALHHGTSARGRETREE